MAAPANKCVFNQTDGVLKIKRGDAIILNQEIKDGEDLKALLKGKEVVVLDQERDYLTSTVLPWCLKRSYTVRIDDEEFPVALEGSDSASRRRSHDDAVENADPKRRKLGRPLTDEEVNANLRQKQIGAAESTAKGEADFYRLKQSGSYFDRTLMIHVLEQHPRAVFLRPPRFGKTTAISMLEYYYDVRFQSRFGEIFAGLKIVDSPTALRNAFYVLRIRLPARAVPDEAKYEDIFHQQVNSCIGLFLSQHPDVGEEEKVLEKNSSQSLLNITIALSRMQARLMLLVDEYDRAPMGAMWQDEACYQSSLKPLATFLSQLKAICETGEHRYYVTGIFPIPMTGLSIFNDSSNLTFRPELADVMGLKENEVEKLLLNVAHVHQIDLPRVMEVARKAYNGYNFSFSECSLYNPQLMHHFVRQYACIKDRLGTDQEVQEVFHLLTDENLTISASQVRLALKDTELKAALLSVCHTQLKQGQVALEKLDALSYLFYAGVVTLDTPNLAAQAKATFRIPNAVLRYSFVEHFLSCQSGELGSAARFLAEPNVHSLHALLLKLMELAPPTHAQTEGDLQGLLMAAFIFTSPYVPLAEHHPLGDDAKKMDVFVRDVVIELKTLSAGGTTQRLNTKAVAGLSNQNAALALTPAGKQALAALDEEDLKALGCQYKNKGVSYKTVGQVHDSALVQVRRYLQSDRNIHHAFAVTQVVDRFLVEATSVVEVAV